MSLVGVLPRTETQPTTVLGGMRGGGGNDHNCLDKAEVLSHHHSEFGEQSVHVKCMVCGRSRTMYFIKQVS